MRCAWRLALILLLVPGVAATDTLRFAVFTAELDRKGPGLLLRDIVKGKDAQVMAAARAIAEVDADVILLCRFDYDFRLVALNAFADVVAQAGASYPHRFALRPNRGMTSGLDLDGDGLLGGPGDAQGFGYFTGQSGMAILSRLPIDASDVRDHSAFLWKDLRDARMPQLDGAAFPSEEAAAIQRLSSTGHWDVPLRLPDDTQVNLLAFHATTPVFDGPEDRNGLRNADEVRFWGHYLDGSIGEPGPQSRFILAGNANLDSVGGDGIRAAMSELLADTRLQDPAPLNKNHASGADRPARIAQHDTVVWNLRNGPDRLRVDYLLPSADMRVLDTGVHWPTWDGSESLRHRIVWTDLVFD